VACGDAGGGKSDEAIPNSRFELASVFFWSIVYGAGLALRGYANLVTGPVS
jgi:hypothetical protein